jgi:hypothetical protein
LANRFISFKIMSSSAGMIAPSRLVYEAIGNSTDPARFPLLISPLGLSGA